MDISDEAMVIALSKFLGAELSMRDKSGACRI